MTEGGSICGSGRHATPRCPLCHWEPLPGDEWVCDCGHVWDTFQTRGRCPRCGYQWEETECLVCWEMSPHEDWYGDD